MEAVKDEEMNQEEEDVEMDVEPVKKVEKIVLLPNASVGVAFPLFFGANITAHTGRCGHV